jgi:hypothetical protein
LSLGNYVKGEFSVETDNYVKANAGAKANLSADYDGRNAKVNLGASVGLSVEAKASASG